MKTISTNGQELILSGLPRRKSVSRVPWPDNAVELVEVGITGNVHFQFAFLFIFRLRDGLQHYYSPNFYDTLEGAQEWARIYDSYFIGGRAAPCEGEAFNYQIRPMISQKFSQSQFHDWQEGHI